MRAIQIRRAAPVQRLLWKREILHAGIFSFASTETFSSSEGETRSDKIEITIAYEVRDACTDARIIEMDKDNLIIRTTALDLDHPAITGSSEYEITTLPAIHIIAVPGENEVLIPQKLQVRFG